MGSADVHLGDIPWVGSTGGWAAAAPVAVAVRPNPNEIEKGPRHRRGLFSFGVRGFGRTKMVNRPGAIAGGHNSAVPRRKPGPIAYQRNLSSAPLWAPADAGEPPSSSSPSNETRRSSDLIREALLRRRRNIFHAKAQRRKEHGPRPQGRFLIAAASCRSVEGTNRVAAIAPSSCLCAFA